MSTSSRQPRRETLAIGRGSLPSEPWEEFLGRLSRVFSRSIRGITLESMPPLVGRSSSSTSNELSVVVSGLPNSWLSLDETGGSFSPPLQAILGWITFRCSSPTDSIEIVLSSSETTLCITRTQNSLKFKDIQQ